MSFAKTTLGLLLSSLLALTACGSSDTTGGGGSGGGGDPGNKPTEITFEKATFSPRYSPDGKSIAYIADTGASGDELWVMDASGGQRKMLTQADKYSLGEAWSLDSKEIYFPTSDGVGLIPAAGGAASLVTKDSEVLHPDLSPDGKRLVYAPFGKNMRLVDLADPTSAKDLGVQGETPRFSPDGASIAFVSGKKINTLDIGTSAVTEILSLNAGLLSVDWFSDGKRLAITTEKGIEILTLGATAERSVVRTEVEARSVDVSPDGKSIAYSILGSNSIYVLGGL